MGFESELDDHHILLTYRSKSSKSWSQKNKLNRVKEITLSGTVSANNTVCSGGKGLDLWLLPKGTKIGNCDLFDVHGDERETSKYRWLCLVATR